MRAIIVSLFVCVMAIPAVSSAEAKAKKNGTPRNECAELIKDCYAQTGIERSNCLFNNSKMPACEKSQLGNLAFRRWSTAPERPTDIQDAPAFLGPIAASDKACLANFDKDFSNALTNGVPTAEALQKLQTKLDSCKVNADLDMRS